jgi:hypothetical protein
MSTAAKRVAISLGIGERDALQQLAHEAGEPMATTAGRLVRAALADHGARLDAPPARRTGPPRPRGTKQRPAPVEPVDAIDALRARYPHELRHLPADPSTDNYIAEQTDGLITLRARLDAAGPDADPYEIFRFGHELRGLAAFLQDRARRSR